MNSIFELKLDKLALVKLAQMAENQFVGVKCGIMDQYINIFGVQENVLRIDCRSLEYKYYPFAFDNISIVLFNTCVAHSLASSEYNRRREECYEQLIKKTHPDVNYLRDVSVELMREFEDKMDPTIYRRCKYVVEENDRLLKVSVDELKVGDLKLFGMNMNNTHKGLSNDYEVSCEELDYLVEMAVDNPYVYGSRMMGGGFGGCTINLIEKNQVEQISQAFAEKYNHRFKSI